MSENTGHDIVLLRHGESVGNVESRWQGQSDYPLTDKGRAQARALSLRWQTEKRTFDRIFSSPLRRAKETAEVIAEDLQIPLETDPIWMERNIGAVAGMAVDEVNRQLAREKFNTPFSPAVGDEGEGDWALFIRAGQALHGLLLHPPGRYLVVSHGGILNQLMHAIVGITPSAGQSGPRFRFQNSGFAHVVYFSQAHRWQINGLNDCAHWNGKDPG
jgi:2,3-bisphosphoglycerate-dependent phosphoglycerate mutase